MTHFLAKFTFKNLCCCFFKQNPSAEAIKLNNDKPDDDTLYDDTPYEDTTFEFLRTNNYFEQYNASIKHRLKI